MEESINSILKDDTKSYGLFLLKKYVPIKFSLLDYLDITIQNYYLEQIWYS